MPYCKNIQTESNTKQVIYKNSSKSSHQTNPPVGKVMLLTLDNASELIPPTGGPGFNPISGVSPDNEVVSSCPPAPVAIACFGTLPTKVVDDVAVGWLMNMTLELGSDFVEESVSFDTATFEAEEEEGVTRINLVTWDLSSVLLARFTPGLHMNSDCGRT